MMGRDGRTLGRRRTTASALTAFVVMVSVVTTAGAATTAPLVAAFGVDPEFTACPSGPATTVVVRVTWDVRNHVSRVAVSGAVDKLGIPLPLSFHNRSGKRSHKVVKLRVRCDGTNQILLLTADGPGGTTKANTTVREQTNP